MWKGKIPEDKTSYLTTPSVDAIVLRRWWMNNRVRSTNAATLAGNTDVLCEISVPIPLCPFLSQYHFVQNISHEDWLGIELSTKEEQNDPQSINP
jgi:hypothetical protein